MSDSFQSSLSRTHPERIPKPRAALPYYIKSCKLKQQRLDSCIIKFDRGLLVLATSFDTNHTTKPEALMLDTSTNRNA